MQLDRSKDKSVNVSTCIRYDFNVLMTVVWKLHISHHKNK